ncbi:hypothetical protein SAMN02982990_01390 [Photorhabdus luminescens]|uniref:Uncharacterized protein n=1 Tax=Photorhabdus luminescens TaxID=29488 RepID=A0A1G5QAL4_PHOLU|nr:hypothetical protein SAMN02982990_01390 [Photorhabdus luminescens]
MSRDQQRLVGYLAHILEAIKRIDSYTEDVGAGRRDPQLRDHRRGQ